MSAEFRDLDVAECAKQIFIDVPSLHSISRDREVIEINGVAMENIILYGKNVRLMMRIVEWGDELELSESVKSFLVEAGIGTQDYVKILFHLFNFPVQVFNIIKREV